jgi:DNA polymerase III delta subunit
VEAGVKGRTGAAYRRALEILARTDRTLKSSPKSPRIVLESAILRICE